jgi:hypothetical protein
VGAAALVEGVPTHLRGVQAVGVVEVREATVNAARRVGTVH